MGVIGIFYILKFVVIALAGVAQWTEHQPVNQRVTGSIPSQGTCLGCRPGRAPSRGCMRGNHTDVSLPLFLLPFQINKKKIFKKFVIIIISD